MQRIRDTILYAFYDALMSALALPLAAWLFAHRKHRPLLARFMPPIPQIEARPIWVQACSVGEVNTARPIIRAFRSAWPDIPVLLTTSTVTGMELAKSSLGDVPCTWFPFDHPLCAGRFMRKVKPLALVLLETELWPGVIGSARQHNVPVIVVNGRLSDKHIARYTKFRRLLEPVVSRLSAAGMQNEEYAARLTQLGADPSCVVVTGNTKFDGVTMAIAQSVLARSREESGFAHSDTILIFGSTRPGDEALAAECWRELRDEYPQLRLIIAPRHVDRLEEALKPFEGEPILCRSEVKAGRKPAEERIFVLDTVGELVKFYALARVAVIGGSFYPGVNGHNPLESAALGVATVFGPYMRNFVDPARALVAQDGAIQVSHPGQLVDVLRGLLNDSFLRTRIADNGRCAVLANQGAVSRTVELVRPFVEIDNMDRLPAGLHETGNV